MKNVILKRLEAIWLQLTYKQSQLSEYVVKADRKIFQKRIRAEGLPFITTTLPRIGKGLVESLGKGYIDSSLFEGWASGNDGKPYPLFLSKAFAVLFDDDGNIKVTTTDTERRNEAGAVACIRQLTELWYKLRVEPTLAQQQEALEAFEATEADLRQAFAYYGLDNVPVATKQLGHFNDMSFHFDMPMNTWSEYPKLSELARYEFETNLGPKKAKDGSIVKVPISRDRDTYKFDTYQLRHKVSHQMEVMREARRIVSRLLAGVSPYEGKPRHGSGASEDKTCPVLRYSSWRFIPRLAECFPYDKYFFYNHSHLADEYQRLTTAEEAEPLARMAFVPKDSRGPRIISAEPPEFMYIQKMLEKQLRFAVERAPAIAAQISWLDQSRNRDMAKEGSIDPTKWATLDLKEASDRLTVQVVSYLFPKNWSDALMASRSLGTVLPAVEGVREGSPLRFAKFAPMGSACCFPVQTICFWAIATAACRLGYLQEPECYTKHNSGADLKVSVYGDDIIVPTEYAGPVKEALTGAGLIVNQNKSFTEADSFFRESCGGDYYKGIPVAPVRLKSLPTDDDPGRHSTCRQFNELNARWSAGSDIADLKSLFEEWYGPVCTTTRWSIDQQGHLVNHVSDTLALIGHSVTVPDRVKRRVDRYCNLVYKLPVTSGVDFKIDELSWGQLLRRELENHPEQPQDLGTFANRVSYTKRYVRL